MKEELTTLMHTEFLEDEVTPLQMRCLGAEAQMSRGVPRKEALRANGLTECQYVNNINEALKRI